MPRNKSPAGAEVLLTSLQSINGQDVAQASDKDASPCEPKPHTESSPSTSMETEKRNNASTQKKNMEAEAATKIQAGFRGYQVRKQLKNKVRALFFLHNSFYRRGLGGQAQDLTELVRPAHPPELTTPTQETCFLIKQCREDCFFCR